MNWKPKRKWLFSLAVTFAMLFPTVAMAATTEPISPDVQPITAADTKPETEETKDGTKENTESETIEDAEEDDLPEAPNDKSPVDHENPDSEPEPFTLFTLSAHDHSWSADWNFNEIYHWHECDSEGCPVVNNSEKDGYAEHSYDDNYICTKCGYYAPDSRSAIAAEEEIVVPTYQQVYEAMTALKEKYPEGMEWTNSTPYGNQGALGSSYVWKGGAIYGANSGVGCAAFAFILSDAAFGSLPARAVANGSFTFEDVKVGDILRVNGNSHSVIVLQKSAAGVIIAEANYNKTVHWGRAMTVDEALAADYIITRYPEGYNPAEDSEAGKVAYSGTEGNLNWSLTNGGILTISGGGAIPDYTPANLPPWNNYNGSIYTIVIEKGVTGIGDYAFYESSALSVYLPDGIEEIGQHAFEKSLLMSITLPGTVETIENSAFGYCANLTSASVSEGLKTIGDKAFYGCTSLTHIDFPASITSVGAAAFMDCIEMTRVRFMPGTEKVTLGDNLFSSCWKLTSVTLPLTSDCISADMFASCSLLPELYIPASVTEIGNNSFNSCNALRYIYFGGTEAAWNKMMGAYLHIPSETEIIFNAPFIDPFADSDDEDNQEDSVMNPSKSDDNESKADSDDNVHQHSWSENWSYDDTCHWHECNADCFVTDNCDKDGYGEHSYGSWVIDVKATATQNGSMHRDCTVCHYRQTSSIPATGSSDDSNDPTVTSREPADTESQVLQEQSKTETSDELSEGDKNELPESDKTDISQTTDEEVMAEDNGKSDKTGTGVIVPVLITFVAVAVVSATGFVFIRKKNLLNK